MNIRGGLTPSLFAKNVWELGGVTPQNEACMSARCWKCIIGRGIEPENVCIVGGTTDKSQWIHNFFKMYASMGGLHLNPIDIFSWETY